jgi:hypothetical protein
MKARKLRKKTTHTGSTFDSFVAQEGIQQEVEAVAIKRVLAWQLKRAMQDQRKTKQAMAKQPIAARSPARPAKRLRNARYHHPRSKSSRQTRDYSCGGLEGEACVIALKSGVHAP